MKFWHQIGSLQKTVLVCTVGAFILWLVWHAPDMADTQNGFIRFVLSFIFSFLILFRPKATASISNEQRSISSDGTLPDTSINLDKQCGLEKLLVCMALAGMLAVVFGLVFGVHQFEWLGILCLLFACF